MVLVATTFALWGNAQESTRGRVGTRVEWGSSFGSCECFFFNLMDERRFFLEAAVLFLLVLFVVVLFGRPLPPVLLGVAVVEWAVGECCGFDGVHPIVSTGCYIITRQEKKYM